MKKYILILTTLILGSTFLSCSNEKTKDQKESKEGVSVIFSEQDDVQSTMSKSSNSTYEVSSGYSTDPDYRPTVSDDGDYHTIDGNRRQIQYQGSQEQQRDLDMIDEYMRNNPEY